MKEPDIQGDLFSQARDAKLIQYKKSQGKAKDSSYTSCRGRGLLPPRLIQKTPTYRTREAVVARDPELGRDRDHSVRLRGVRVGGVPLLAGEFCGVGGEEGV